MARSATTPLSGYITCYYLPLDARLIRLADVSIGLRLIGVISIVLLLQGSGTPGLAQSQPYCGTGEAAGFAFGFASIKTLLGPKMGEPVSCEYADPNGSGDTLQDTTTGLCFWRESTNVPTFTDGANHWGLTNVGLVAWTGPSIDPPPTPQNWTPPRFTRTSECVSHGGLPDAACTRCVRSGGRAGHHPADNLASRATPPACAHRPHIQHRSSAS